LHRQSDSRRRIFLSYYYLHRSSADIAHAMGLSRSAVQKQLASIKRELRTLFESEDITL
jgi:DNA-directed RNA polymerase specialized sigma24 family protein